MQVDDRLTVHCDGMPIAQMCSIYLIYIEMDLPGNSLLNVHLVICLK